MDLLLHALKKTKKNIRRVFSEDEHAHELYELLTRPALKSLFLIYSGVISAKTFLSGEFSTVYTLINDVCSDLQKVSTDGYNFMSAEAENLYRVLSKDHMRAVAICVQDISAANFCASTLYYNSSSINERLENNLSQTLFNDALLEVHIPSRNNLAQYNGRKNSVPLKMQLTEDVKMQTNSRAVPGGVRLTGGGEGLPMKPVDDNELRLISFERDISEDLGITIGVKEKEVSMGYARDVYVRRIMAGSQVERQGLLGVGDIIREVNGVPIDRPETLLEQFVKSPATVTMKIIPAHKDPQVKSQLYVRALFTYDPNKDKLLPCKEAGLRFKCYDVLQVLNQSDPNWWQARHHDSNGHAGLIPSDSLEERRKALIQSLPDVNTFKYRFFKGLVNEGRTKKTKITFRAKDFEAFTSKNVCVYEEVALISGFQRPVVCLLGAPGIGRQTLRDMLIEDNPDRYELAIPYTSRKRLPGEEDGVDFFFESARKMQNGYQRNHFIEFGEADGEFYGTKVKTLRRIAQSGKTCLLDCSPSAVSRIRTSEFMPFVVFLAAPSCNCMKAMYEYGRSMGLTETWKRDEDFRRTLEYSQEIERNYRQFFDRIVICDNIEVTFVRLKEILDDLLVKPQWVPAKWLF